MSLLALYLLSLFSTIVYAAPKPQAPVPAAAAGSSTYWLANIPHNGVVAYGSDPNYPVYRNVMAYGAVGE